MNKIESHQKNLKKEKNMKILYQKEKKFLSSLCSKKFQIIVHEILSV